MLTPLIIQAALFADQCHKGQVRKFASSPNQAVPFISHPIRVACRVSTHPVATEELIAAALLHDVMEDCGVTREQLASQFGGLVAYYVDCLTNRKHLVAGGRPVSRSLQKRLDRLRLIHTEREVKILKMIDRIDNLRELSLTNDNDFRNLYGRESMLLADVLCTADVELARELIDLAEKLFDRNL